MSTTKFEHVIGRDGLHRIRKTCKENGEIIDCSHEGFSSPEEARENEVRVFSACLHQLQFLQRIHSACVAEYRASLLGIPTVDERDSEPVPAEPAADSLRHERVFGKPADPFEPQTPCPVEPQLR